MRFHRLARDAVVAPGERQDRRGAGQREGRERHGGRAQQHDAGEPAHVQQERRDARRGGEARRQHAAIEVSERRESQAEHYLAEEQRGAAAGSRLRHTHQVDPEVGGSCAEGQWKLHVHRVQLPGMHQPYLQSRHIR